MPSTAVYFVSPRLIASTAACLILSGVSKSGSPAPRPMTSRPAALSSRALVVTAMVGDGLMRDRRSARNGMALLARSLRGAKRRAHPIRRPAAVQHQGTHGGGAHLTFQRPVRALIR